MEELPRAEVVVVACPLTKKTRGLIGAPQFRAMKDGAYFINVARGGIVDFEALAAAARSGKLAGVGLDVTDPEPLPDGSALWGLDNVIITPHNAGQSDGSRRRVQLLVRENIRRFVAGEPLLNVVDKEEGY
jgi:phosphoglycerate dehydrogenase-like enzyme